MGSHNKPSIIIVYTKITPLEDIKNEITWGIEEEGMSHEEIPLDEEEALNVSVVYQHAGSSNLGIAIGINSEEIVLHYKKMNEKNPVFFYKLNSLFLKENKELFRNIGKNACKLAKNKPFIEI